MGQHRFRKCPAYIENEETVATRNILRGQVLQECGLTAPGCTENSDVLTAFDGREPQVSTCMRRPNM